MKSQQTFLRPIIKLVAVTLVTLATSGCRPDSPTELAELGLPHSVLRYHLIFNRCYDGPSLQVGAVTTIESYEIASDPILSEPGSISWGPSHLNSQTFSLSLYTKNFTDFNVVGTLMTSNWSQNNRSEVQATPCFFGGTADVPADQGLDLDSITSMYATTRESQLENQLTNRIYSLRTSDASPNLIPQPALWEELMREPAYNSALFSNTQIKLLQGDGSRTGRIDFAFLAEGFTQAQIDEGVFERKVQEHLDQLFQIEPYRAWKNRINVWLVLTPSRESGVSDMETPTQRDTFYGLTKNFSCGRSYLPIRLHRIHAAANLVPHDVTILLFNGAGNQTSSANWASGERYMLLDTVDGRPSALPHELGHYLFGFADQYFALPDRPMVTREGRPLNRDQTASVGCTLPEAPLSTVSSARQLSENTNPQVTDRPRNIAPIRPGSPIPWQHLIPAGSFQGLTRFALPVSKAGWDGDPGTSATITYELRNIAELQTLKLFFGYNYPRLRDSSRPILPISISLDGVIEPVDSAHLHIVEPTLAFYPLNTPSLPTGTPHTLKLTYSNHQDAEKVLQEVYLTTDLGITHRIFRTSEIGAYEGTNRSFLNDYRPSFQGMMNTNYAYPIFNAYEIELINADFERLAR